VAIVPVDERDPAKAEFILLKDAVADISAAARNRPLPKPLRRDEPSG
jgi:hypothetical protein